jgi:hypothetical protein
VIRISRIEWVIRIHIELDVRTALDRVGVNPQIEQLANPVDDAVDLDHEVRSRSAAAA